ncbi:MAG TPA: YtxH domain-containing protein [Ktedonobacteraceae bacterium]|nr:YtxH domain-containing protein [Ktedonobacteraceae bacterium]
MGSFINGVLVGMGISLLFAPMRGEEMRRMLAERTREMRSSSSNNLDQQRLTSRVEEVRQQASYTAPTGTTSQPTTGSAYSTPSTSSTSSSATSQTGAARPAGPAGQTERSQQSGTNRSQTGQNPSGSRPNKQTP